MTIRLSDILYKISLFIFLFFVLQPHFSYSRLKYQHYNVSYYTDPAVIRQLQEGIHHKTNFRLELVTEKVPIYCTWVIGSQNLPIPGQATLLLL
jgi:hypothetical protein